jgi:hypothetical protein
MEPYLDEPMKLCLDAGDSIEDSVVEPLVETSEDGEGGRRREGPIRRGGGSGLGLVSGAVPPGGKEDWAFARWGAMEQRAGGDGKPETLNPKTKP